MGSLAARTAAILAMAAALFGATPAWAGEETTAIVKVNMSDGQLQFTDATIRNDVFTSSTSINAWLKEASWGTRSLVGKINHDGGDVLGPYTVNASKNSVDCLFSNWSEEAKAQALQGGIDLTQYDHVMYFIADVAGCNYSTAGGVGSKEMWAFETSGIWKERWALVFAQGDGVTDADTLTCKDASNNAVPFSANCTSGSLQDPYDPTGPAMRHFNLSHTLFLGVMPDSKAPIVTTDGDYTISPLENGMTGNLGLRVWIPYDKTVDAPRTRYWDLEIRQPTGFDNFAADDPVANGVSIRYDSRKNDANTNLIDASASTGQSLRQGETFTDSVHGISIQATAVSTLGATVHVHFNSPNDTTGPAAVSNLVGSFDQPTQKTHLAWSASPSSDVWFYRILDDQVPFDHHVWDVEAPTTSYDDTYGATPFGVHHYTVIPYDNFANAGTPMSVDVDNRPAGFVQDTEPPTAPTNLTGSLSGYTATLHWGPSTDNLGTVHYWIFVDGQQANASDTTDGSVFLMPGTHSVDVRAADGAFNVSAPSNALSFTVTDPNGATTSCASCVIPPPFVPGTSSVPPPPTNEIQTQPGRGQCKVPKLVGVKLAAAKRALVNAKCAVGKVTKKKGAKKKKGKVLKASPATGKFPAGKKINLTVGT